MFGALESNRALAILVWKSFFDIKKAVKYRDELIH